MRIAMKLLLAAALVFAGLMGLATLADRAILAARRKGRL
jgi:cytochrome oxidase Cu insertion factor (SCO1/SenC/PrrC family)